MIIVLSWPAAEPLHPPPPQGEGGRGEGGEPTTATQRPKGERCRRPGRGGAAPANGDRARPTAPGRSVGRATRRAATEPAPGPTKQNPNFVKNCPLFLTKWRGGFVGLGVLRGPDLPGAGLARCERGRVDERRLSGGLQFPGKVLEIGSGGGSAWGGTTTPPQG